MERRRPEPETEGTRKTEIIQSLFETRFNTTTKKLSSTVVTLEEVSAAINANNLAHPTLVPMSTRNPANFFKDFIRKHKSANRNWPRRIFQAFAAFFSPQQSGAGPKPLICKEMAENKPFRSNKPVNKL